MPADGAEGGAERSEDGQDPSPSPDEETAHEAVQASQNGDTVTVVVDINEPTDLRMLSLAHDDVDDWMEARLDAADYVVNGVGFERKTPDDFASSITDGRLVEQAEKLADAYDHAYVLLEGQFADFDAIGHSRLNPQSMRGMAASLTARHGIPVIPCDDFDGLLDHAIRLGRKHTEDPVSDHLPTGPVGSDEPAGKRMWGCLPNVGPELAGRLYEEFGSPVDWHLKAQPALTDVAGIGEVTAGKMKEAMLDG